MKLIGRSFIVSAMAILFLVPLGAQVTDSVATGWIKTFTVTKHAGATLDTVLVTDEVSAGWDFDGDGNKEFLVFTDNSNPNGGGTEFTSGASIFLYEGSASGYELVWSWMDTSIHTGGASFPAQAVGDLDGDGNLEVLLGLPYGTGNPPDGSDPARFFVWEADANGLPASVGGAPPVPTAIWNFGASVGTNTRPSSMATDDVDGDGANEVVVGFRAFSGAATNDAVIIFSLNGDFAGEFTQWTTELVDTTSEFGGSIYAAAVTDMDGDGNKEFFVPSFASDRGYFWEAAGPPNIYHPVVVVSSKPHWLGGLHSAFAYDVDGDGATELFIGNGQKNIAMMHSVSDLSLIDTSEVDTSDAFVSAIITGLPQGVRGMAVGDFDENGNVDIFVGGNYAQSVLHYEYDGSGAIADAGSWIDHGVVYQQHAFVDDTLQTSGPSRVYSVAFGSAVGNRGAAAASSDLDGNNHGDLVIGFEDGDSTATSYVVIVENTGTFVAIEFRPGIQLANAYRLSKNYPNPFNPSTTLDYSLTKAGRVEIVIYDLLGHEVSTLAARDLQPGEYSVSWDGLDKAGNAVASGVYIARMKINGATLTTRMTLLK